MDDKPQFIRLIGVYERDSRLFRYRNSRHTFASDMVRAGVSLPALMQLMGHAHIQTTMVYVQVTPLEVYQQYARAVAQQIRPVPRARS